MGKIRQRIACKAIIVHRAKVLIIREAATYADGTNIGKYHLPGGRIEPGEPFMEGLAREILEETGLHVQVGSPIFVGEWFPDIRGQQNQIVAIFFACTARTNRVILSEEHDAYHWIDPAAYMQYNLMPPEGDVFRAYLQHAANR
jgi:8-oxo-dGTP diphosphatase